MLHFVFCSRYNTLNNCEEKGVAWKWIHLKKQSAGESTDHSNSSYEAGGLVTSVNKKIKAHSIGVQNRRNQRVAEYAVTKGTTDSAR